MEVVRILTAWRKAIDRTPEGGNVPQVCLDYALKRFSDITRWNPITDPTIPDMLVISATVEDVVLAAIELDSNYVVIRRNIPVSRVAVETRHGKALTVGVGASNDEIVNELVTYYKRKRVRA